MFIVMFEWQMLAGEYGPARNALARARDAQAQQLMEGDNRLRSGRPYPGTRFQLIAGINDTLQDPQSTVDLFVHMEGAMPEPLARIGELNAVAAGLSLFPPLGAGPRLAGELADPGTIFRELGAHREAQEARAGRLRLVPNQNPPG